MHVHFTFYILHVAINGFHSSISCRLPPVVMSHLPSHDYEGLSKLQEEATYEVVDQPRPPPPADYQLSACAAYAPTDFNTENK